MTEQKYESPLWKSDFINGHLFLALSECHNVFNEKISEHGEDFWRRKRFFATYEHVWMCLAFAGDHLRAAEASQDGDVQAFSDINLVIKEFSMASIRILTALDQLLEERERLNGGK